MSPKKKKKTNLVQGRYHYEDHNSLCFLLACSVPGTVLSALYAFYYLIFTDRPFDCVIVMLFLLVIIIVAVVAIAVVAVVLLSLSPQFYR